MRRPRARPWCGSSGGGLRAPSRSRDLGCSAIVAGRGEWPPEDEYRRRRRCRRRRRGLSTLGPSPRQPRRPAAICWASLQSTVGEVRSPTKTSLFHWPGGPFAARPRRCGDSTPATNTTTRRFGSGVQGRARAQRVPRLLLDTRSTQRRHSFWGTRARAGAVTEPGGFRRNGKWLVCVCVCVANFLRLGLVGCCVSSCRYRCTRVSRAPHGDICARHRCH